MGKKAQYETCNTCRHRNNISEMLSLNDYDESWREGYILICCQECSNQIEAKIK